MVTGIKVGLHASWHQTSPVAATMLQCRLGGRQESLHVYVSVCYHSKLAGKTVLFSDSVTMQSAILSTRKLCCRKDDRAMRTIGYMDALNFRDTLTTPTATIPNIFSWSFVPIDPMNVPTKFEVRSFTRS